VQDYFDTFALDSLYITAVRSSDQVVDLNELRLDVSTVDAARGYLAWRRFTQQVLVAEGASRSAGGTTYTSQILARAGSGFTTFASLSGSTLCAPQFLGTDTLMAFKYGRDNGNIADVAATGATEQARRVDACQSAYSNTMRGWLASGACIAPGAADRASACSACGLDTLLPTAGASSATEGACNTGLRTYTGPASALQRLAQGICGAALLRSTTYTRLCVEPVQAGRTAPAWCPEAGPSAFVSVAAGSASGLGTLPTGVMMVRDDSYTASMLASLYAALRGINSNPSVLAVLQWDGVTAPGSTVGPVGPIANYGTATASSTHFQQNGFDVAMAALPGVTEYVTCSGCTPATPLCARGATAAFPLRIALPIAASDTAAMEPFNEYFSYLRDANFTSPPIYMVGVATELNTMQALELRRADIAWVDAAQAYQGFTKFGHLALAFEQIVDNRTGTPTTATSYTASVYATATTAATIGSSFAALKGLSACHGSLLSLNALTTFSVGLATPVSTQMSYTPNSNPLLSSQGQTLESCRSPALDVANGFFAAAGCAPPLSAGEVSICTSCASACMGNSIYGRHFGSVRGLAEQACDVAFARDLSLSEYCGAQPIGGTAATWCTAATNRTVGKAALTLGSFPSDAFMTRPSIVDSSVSSVLPTAVALLSTNLFLSSNALPAFGYRGLIAASAFDATTTSTHLSPVASVFTNVPGGAASLANTDTPTLTDGYPVCGAVVVSGLGSSESTPLKVAAPVGVDATELAALGRWFAAARTLQASAQPVYMSAVPLVGGVASATSTAVGGVTGAALDALRTGKVDAVLVDAATAWMGWQRFGHRVVAVEQRATAVNPADATDTRAGARPVMLVKSVAGTTVYNLSSQRGKRLCTGTFTSAGTWLVAGWARANNASTGFGVTPNGWNAAVNRVPDACDADVYTDMASYFTGGLCAPPMTQGEVGTCQTCPSGTTSCSMESPYAGPEGALRGLSEGVCDVAIVRSDTYSKACAYTTTVSETGETVTSRPAWCLDEGTLAAVTDFAAAQATVGRAPTRAWMVRKDSLSDAIAAGFMQALVALSSLPDVASVYGLAGVAPVYSAPGSTTPLTPATEAATSAHLTPLSSATVFPSVPGITPYRSCSTAGFASLCAATVPGDCRIKGSTALNPVFFALPVAAWSTNGVALFQDYFDRRVAAAIAAGTTATYIKAVISRDIGAGLGNSLEALVRQYVDIVALDPAPAYLGWRRYGYQVIMQELTQLTEARSYRLTPWVRANSAYKTFASLRGAVSCHGSYISMPALGAVSFGLSNWAATGFNTTAADSPSPAPVSVAASAVLSVDACAADARQLLAGYFSRSCAAPDAAGRAGLCESCPSMPDRGVKCDLANAFAGPWGAMRALAEGVCDVAFARESSWQDICGGGNPAPPAWCPATPLVPLTHETDPLISATAGMGLAPGHALMVRPGSLSDSALAGLYGALTGLNSNSTLLSLFRFPRGLAPPIDGQVATEAGTSLALSPVAAVLANVPGVAQFIAQTAAQTPPATCQTFPQLGRFGSRPTASEAVTTTSSTGSVAFTRATATPALGGGPSGAIRFAVPGSVDLPVLREFQAYWDSVAEVSGLFVQAVTGTNSPAALQSGDADVIYVDSTTALMANARFSHQIVAIEADYAVTSRQTTDVTASGVRTETETIEATIRTGLGTGAWALTSEQPVFGLYNWPSLRSARLCVPSMLSSAGTVLPLINGLSNEFGITSLASPAIPATAPYSTTSLDACDSPIVSNYRSFFGAVCAPPSVAGEAGICDLCSSSGTSIDIATSSSATLNTTAAACDASNLHAGERGALLGLSTRVCQVALLRDDTPTRFCDPVSHPLGSKLSGFLSPFNVPDSVLGNTSASASASSFRPPSWCHALTDYARIAPDQEISSSLRDTLAPTSAFMVRAGSLNATTLTQLYEALEALSARPILLKHLGAHGVTHPNAAGKTITIVNTRKTTTATAGSTAVATSAVTSTAGTPVAGTLATQAATDAHLSAWRTTMTTYTPGFTKFSQCQTQTQELLLTASGPAEAQCAMGPPSTCATLGTARIVLSDNTNAAAAGAVPGIGLLALLLLAALALASGAEFGK